MASLPLDPIYARVLLSSFDEGCPRDMIDLVSLLGSRDNLLVNTAATRQAADAARAKFLHRTGDHLMLLNVLRAFQDVRERDERKSWCRDNFVNLRAMAQVLEARRQLVERCKRLGLDCDVSSGDDAEPILNALVSGLFGNTAVLQPDGSYRHTGSRRVSESACFSSWERAADTLASHRPSTFILDQLYTTSAYRQSCTTNW